MILVFTKNYHVAALFDPEATTQYALVFVKKDEHTTGEADGVKLDESPAIFGTELVILISNSRHRKFRARNVSFFPLANLEVVLTGPNNFF